jgi:hypothetical protein
LLPDAAAFFGLGASAKKDLSVFCPAAGACLAAGFFMARLGLTAWVWMARG